MVVNDSKFNVDGDVASIDFTASITMDELIAALMANAPVTVTIPIEKSKSYQLELTGKLVAVAAPAAEAAPTS